MEGILKKAQVLILIAVLVSGIAYLTRPAYAAGIYSETSSMTMTPKFVSARKGAKVTLRWSKACSMLQDGSVCDASGYEIQYASNKKFTKAKTLDKGAADCSAVVKLSNLNSLKKYKKYIGKYHFRIRSYVTVDGVKTYSKWSKAAKFKTVCAHFPARIKTPEVIDDIDGNKISLEWEKPNQDISYDGYYVYRKTAADNSWKRMATFESEDVCRHTDDGLSYEEEYSYMVLAYKHFSTRDPRGIVNTSIIHVLSTMDSSKVTATTTKLVLDKPEISAAFRNDDLIVSWDAVSRAQRYEIEISETDDFNIKRTVEVKPMGDCTSYQQPVDGLKEKTLYYIKMKALADNKGETVSSDYSDIKTAKYENLNYTIVFSGNGGKDADGNSVKEYTVQRDTDFKLPKNAFVKDGYTFAGWCAVAENRKKYDMYAFQLGKADYAESQSVKNLAEAGQKITLYACWRGSSPKTAAYWAYKIAKDDTFCYGTVVRNQCWFCGDKYQTFNCNSFCAAAYQHGMPGVIPGFSKLKSNGKYTRRNGSTEPSWWIKEGFVKVGTNISASKIKRGDIICCYGYDKSQKRNRWKHIMIAWKDGKSIVHAAHKGTGPDSLCVATMQTRLNNYKKYTVVRYGG